MSQRPILLPIATIQTDFQSLINDVLVGLVPEDSFWLSCYKTGEQSVHGKVHLALNEHDRDVVDYIGVGGVQFAREVERTYAATCSSLGIERTHLAVAARSYSDFLPRTQNASYRAISAFDIAPDRSQFAVGYGDGSVYIVPVSSASTSATSTSKSHLSAVTSVQFFPSSRVLLTAGVDFALNILSAEYPASPTPADQPQKVTPVRTLKGHSRAVTSTAIVSRGRNILSGGKDGTVRLWDVSSGAQIRMMGTKKYSGVLSISAEERAATIFSPPSDHDGDTNPQIPLSVDPREVETGGKIVFCGLSDGAIEAFDLSTKLSVFHSEDSKSLGAVNSVAYSSGHSLLAAGYSTGIVRIFDTRSLSSPLVSFQRNSASIEDVVFLSYDGGVGLAIATEDGLPYVAHIRPEGPSVQAELVGPDCDAVRRVRTREEEIWTAGDDGIVRKYDALNT